MNPPLDLPTNLDDGFPSIRAMNIKHLETFIHIVGKGSFAAAAEALHTTQSTVSARVKDLEHYLGVELFDRSAHRASLTAKGRELLVMSQEITGALQRLRERISDQSAITGTLRLGVVGVVAGTWLPSLVRELRMRHPSLQLQLEVNLSKILVRKLHSGAQLDAVVIAGRWEDDELRCEVVGTEKFAWMASPSLGLPQRFHSPFDLAAHPVVGFSAESFHHAVIKAWFSAGGVQYQPTIICNSMEVIARLVAQGQGVGLLPCEYYGEEVALGKLKVLQTEPEIPDVDFTMLSIAKAPTVMVSALANAVKAVRGHDAVLS